MSIQHSNTTPARWFQMPFLEQMANIGSEVERALNWKSRNNINYSQKAFERALELVDFTLEDTRNELRLAEITRVREALVDYFYGNNEFSSTELSWKKYFLYFAYAARKNH
jgi:hypothetical protein